MSEIKLKQKITVDDGQLVVETEVEHTDDDFNACHDFVTSSISLVELKSALDNIKPLNEPL